MYLYSNWVGTTAARVIPVGSASWAVWVLIIACITRVQFRDCLTRAHASRASHQSRACRASDGPGVLNVTFSTP